ncbi:hypothetical protein R1sor_026157 [Riccia sorocarpa]|uniref:Uncharacterized protein n=1 Tax=Riccia sorocarpa TaxID=122646 RepID=A0ABD3GEM3_9MARC
MESAMESEMEDSVEDSENDVDEEGAMFNSILEEAGNRLDCGREFVQYIRRFDPERFVRYALPLPRYGRITSYSVECMKGALKPIRGFAPCRIAGHGKFAECGYLGPSTGRTLHSRDQIHSFTGLLFSVLTKRHKAADCPSAFHPARKHGRQPKRPTGPGPTNAQQTPMNTRQRQKRSWKPKTHAPQTLGEPSRRGLFQNNTDLGNHPQSKLMANSPSNWFTPLAVEEEDDNTASVLVATQLLLVSPTRPTLEAATSSANNANVLGKVVTARGTSARRQQKLTT